MSLFKDLIKSDLENIIFNEDEFSEVHTITSNNNAKKCRAIIDKEQLLERTGGKTSEHTNGLYLDQILLYVMAEDYGARPAIGKIITLDGKKIYKIIDVDSQNGLYILTLEAHKAQ